VTEEQRKADAREYARVWRIKNPDKAQNNELQRHYGISLEDYKAVLHEQAGGCAVCGRPPGSVATGNKSKGTLAVDHDHATGVFRGLLCTNCNLGIGSFFDNPELLVKAATYLQAHRELVERLLIQRERIRLAAKDLVVATLEDLSGP
jgi:hypothetical protein